jgi:hypothetical protein
LLRELLRPRLASIAACKRLGFQPSSPIGVFSAAMRYPGS